MTDKRPLQTEQTEYGEACSLPAVSDKGTKGNGSDLKKQKARLLRSCFILFVAMTSLVVAVVAWFVNNSKMQATGITIGLDDRAVELRSYGTAGVHDDVLKRILGTDGEKGFWYKLGLGANPFSETSTGYAAINWLLSPDSNIGNYSDVPVDWTDPNANRQEMAIEPGSSGRVSFSIVPKYSGDVKLDMNLDLIPMAVSETSFSEIPEDSIEHGFIDGHIRFYMIKPGLSGAQYLEWIEDGAFSIEIDNAEANREYVYTLYWCWPQTFAVTVLKARDVYLNGRAPLFYANVDGLIGALFGNSEDMRRYLLTVMTNDPQHYFFSNLTGAPLEPGQKDLAYIDEIYNTLSTDMSFEARNAFVELSSYYNQADQYIGKNVNCVRVSLTGDLRD
ncbi:MAG: hypothetical protein Q4B73_09100 [Lachnospiraceae bacterium]|nr:hypothetical protein [Lachnospiraceae bacterium]